MNREFQEQRRWHLSKEVSVVDIITIITASVGLLTAWVSVKQDIAVLQTESSERKRIIETMKSDFDSALMRIENKLDRLIERKK